MGSDGDGIHLYGASDPDNPAPPAEGGMRGERAGNQGAGGNKASASGTPGGNDPEKVEDRANVSMVTPEDYPAGERAAARVDKG